MIKRTQSSLYYSQFEGLRSLNANLKRRDDLGTTKSLKQIPIAGDSVNGAGDSSRHNESHNYITVDQLKKNLVEEMKERNIRTANISNLRSASEAPAAPDRSLDERVSLRQNVFSNLRNASRDKRFSGLAEMAGRTRTPLGLQLGEKDSSTGTAESPYHNLDKIINEPDIPL